MTTFGYLYRASVQAALESIAAAGYRLVEIAPAPPQLLVTEFAAEQRARLKGLLGDLNLACVSINPPELNLISPNPEIRELALRHYRECIRLAHDLGAGIVIVLAGRQSPLIPMPHAAAKEMAVNQLSLLAEDAHRYAVNLAVETVPFGFNETSAEVAAIVKQLDDERIGIALDVANIYGREDVRAAVATCAGSLMIAHLSDTWKSRWAHTSVGAGEVDFVEYLTSLESIGFDGPCIYELVDGADPDPRIRGDLAILKGLGMTV